MKSKTISIQLQSIQETGKLKYVKNRERLVLGNATPSVANNMNSCHDKFLIGLLTAGGRCSTHQVHNFFDIHVLYVCTLKHPVYTTFYFVQTLILGRLIGMATAIYSPSGASAGVGFAIPVDTVKYVVAMLIQNGQIIRPLLGVSILDSKQARQALGISRGILILEVKPGTPAYQAGLRGLRRTDSGIVEIGDIIIAIEGYPIEKEGDLFRVCCFTNNSTHNPNFAYIYIAHRHAPLRKHVMPTGN